MMLKVSENLTDLIKFMFPDIGICLVSDCYSHFFSVCRQVDYKRWVVIWPKLQVKLCFLKSSSTVSVFLSCSIQSKLKVTNLSFVKQHVCTLTKTHLRLYFIGRRTVNRVTLIFEEFTFGRDLDVV